MNDYEIDADLQRTAQRVGSLSRQVEIDLQHKMRLRQELLRRHHELSAEPTQRAAGKLWPRFARLKGLTLVAPSALAATALLTVIAGVLQVSGHRSTQMAEAQRLDRALARSAPTVTSWNLTLRQERGNSAFLYSIPTDSGQHLFVRGTQTYVYTRHAWWRIMPSTSTKLSAADWQYAFALLPAHLASGKFTILPARFIDGQNGEGVRYVLRQNSSDRDIATAWVNPRTGLVIRLDRVLMRAGTVIERDSASYRYQRTP